MKGEYKGMKATLMKTALLSLLLACTAQVAFGATGNPHFFYKVVSAKVQGLVFYDDAQTPAADLNVRVWDIDQREFIYQTYTDDYGAFYLPKLEPGKYYIMFETLRLDLEVTPEYLVYIHQPHDIIVIIPRGTAGMTLPQLSALLIGATITEGAMIYQNQKREPVVSP